MLSSHRTQRALVTGASGFIGRHACEQLIEAGFAVHAITRREDGHLGKLGVATSIGDLWDERPLSAALDGVTIIIHCAGDPHFGNGPQYKAANAELTDHLLRVVRQRCPGLQRFVLVSSIGAVDRPPGDQCTEPLTESSPTAPSSDYGRSKLEAEVAVRRSGLPYAIVRPAMVVGEDMRCDSHFAVFSRLALRRSAFGRIAWPGRFSVIHVDDLARALVQVATAQDAADQTYFCAGESISVAECFEQSRPGTLRIPIAWATIALRPVLRWLPFAAKALLMPALTASDGALRSLGWRPLHDARTALASVIGRERARMDPHLDPGGQTVITGAASGLGRAMVMQLAPHRQHLLIVDRDRETLRRMAADHPNCRPVVVNLAAQEEMEVLYRSKEWNQFPIRELFACAGIGARGAVLDVPLTLHRDMFVVNVIARLSMAIMAIKDMRREQFGRVVFISSSSAFQPLPYMATYAATNAALLSVGEAWGYEISRDGIHLMTVCPGGMQTNFQRSSGVKELKGERLMSPEAVAHTILSGLAAHRSTLVVSMRSFAMSMLARALPRTRSVRLWGKLMSKLR